jgi:hypothetical protein
VKLSRPGGVRKAIPFDVLRAALVLAMITLAGAARAQPAAPSGAHPRILLDDALRAQWKKAAGERGSFVQKAIAHCEDARRDPHEYDHDNYMRLDWSGHLQACLVAWVATGRDDDAQTAIKYFTAILDDFSDVGDGKGGDDAVAHDDGFPIRAMGPFTAVAYDWLHDKLPEPVRARARRRFKAWTDWYEAHGYRARDPANNYHAGFVAAATLMAIAEGGEAGADGDALWRFVADQMWGKDMKAALADGGLLDGGDWMEGWQYGPLAVAEYALAARAAAKAGIGTDGVPRWLEQLLTRTIHGQEPDGRTFAVGDTEAEQASIDVSPLPLAAVAFGDSTEHVAAQAKGELRRIGAYDKQFPFYLALVDGRALPDETVARATWPTSYLAGNSNVLYARTAWRDDAVWAAFVCNRAVDTDHHHPDAGNLAVSRGADEVIVDPSPYGTQSTLTSNAPTVISRNMTDEYKPSQGFWSTATGYAFATQTKGGLLAVRCDYADQYRWQDKPTDIKRALRDVVLVPWNDGADASVVVVDRATTADGGDLFLRFRTPGALALEAGVARGKVGKSSLAIRRVWASGGTPEVRHLAASDCFKPGTVRGKCDAARFPIDEYRTQIPGPSPEAVHVLDLGGDSGATANGDAARVIALAARGKDPARYVIVADDPGDPLTYTIPKPGPAGSEHVILDAPVGGDGTVGVAVAPSGNGCAITLSSSGGALRVTAGPASISVDASCAATDAAPRKAGAAPNISAHPGKPGGGPRRGGGCCGASATPGSSAAMALVVLAALRRRRVPRRT